VFGYSRGRQTITMVIRGRTLEPLSAEVDVRTSLHRHREAGNHRGPDGRQDLQLAVHDVWRAHRFTVPVLWTIGFMVAFIFGGLTGVLLALPPVDWQVHNSLFLVAHFHHVIIPASVRRHCGLSLLVPKAFGFKLDERWGKAAFWCWFVGFHLAFMPLYVTGLMGMTRRLQHYERSRLATVAHGRRSRRCRHFGGDCLSDRRVGGFDP